MKKCKKCNADCYDVDLYCSECGTKVATPLECPYCSHTIHNVYAKNCSSCGAPITFDSYPNNMGVTICNHCHQRRPVAGKYCTSCGRASTVEHTPNVYVNKDAGKQVFKAVALGFAFISVVPSLFCAFIFIVSYIVSAFGNADTTDSYVTSDTPPEVIMEEIATADDLPSYKVDTLDKCINSVAEGDMISITGTIQMRDAYSCTLIPDELTADNIDYRVDVYWSNNTAGRYVADYYTVGDVITIEGVVSGIYSSIGEIALDGYFIEGVVL